MRFWNVVKEVTTQAIREEARRSFLMGITGEPAAIDAVRLAFMGPDPTPEQIEVASSFLMVAPQPISAEDLRELSRCHLVLLADNTVSPADVRPAPTLPVTNPLVAVERLLDRRPDWSLSLARHFPGFRQQVSDRIIANVSRVNAEVAIVSALPTSIPVLAPLFPAVATTDTLILTKNQIMMLMRLAAAHGLEPAVTQRLKELMPVVGGAFGWRTVARQLVGLVPGGAGVVVKGTIAFTGTYVTGRAALLYYQHRRVPTRAELKQLYAEASSVAKGVVSDTVHRLRREKKGTGGDVSGRQPGSAAS
jgi:uncharacterized protein (DUF697 family)